MVDENAGKSSDSLRDGMCSVCEMTVVWMQNQLRQNQTKERIINYINEVKKSRTSKNFTDRFSSEYRFLLTRLINSPAAM